MCCPSPKETILLREEKPTLSQTTEHQSYTRNTKVLHRTPRSSKTYVRAEIHRKQGPLSVFSKLPVMSLEYAKGDILMLN